MNQGEGLKVRYLSHLEKINQNLTGLKAVAYADACDMEPDCAKAGMCLRATALLAAAQSPRYPGKVLGADMSKSSDICELLKREFQLRGI